MKAYHIKNLYAVLMGMVIGLTTYVKERLKVSVPSFYLKKLENKTVNLTQRKEKEKNNKDKTRGAWVA